MDKKEALKQIKETMTNIPGTPDKSKHTENQQPPKVITFVKPEEHLEMRSLVVVAVGHGLLHDVLSLGRLRLQTTV